MAGASVCVKDVGVKKQSVTQEQCTLVERNGQLVFTLNSEIMLPEDAPVRLTNAQLEELDYRKLYAAYSSRGQKSVTDPRVLFKMLAPGRNDHFRLN